MAEYGTVPLLNAFGVRTPPGKRGDHAPDTAEKFLAAAISDETCDPTHLSIISEPLYAAIYKRWQILPFTLIRMIGVRILVIFPLLSYEELLSLTTVMTVTKK